MESTTIFSSYRPTTFSQSKKSDQLTHVYKICYHLLADYPHTNNEQPMTPFASNSRLKNRYISIALSFSGLLLILLAGCSDPQRQHLVGVWQIETADDVADQINASDDDAKIESLPPRMTIEFTGSGQLKTTTVMGEIDRTKEGSWDVVSFDEPGKVIVIKCTIGLQETDHEVDLIDDSTIELVPPNMAGVDMKLRFTKSQK